MDYLFVKIMFAFLFFGGSLVLGMYLNIKKGEKDPPVFWLIGVVGGFISGMLMGTLI